MSYSPSLANDTAPATPPAGNVAAFQAVLLELVAIGADFARMLQAQACAQQDGPGAETVVRAAVAFERVSRSVRRSIGLAQKLGEPVVDAASARALARRRIAREVEDAIQRQASGDAAERLAAELGERLDSPDLEDEIAVRPVADIIADICRDLGIAALPGTAPWKRRTPAEVAALCAHAAAGARPAPGRRPRARGS